MHDDPVIKEFLNITRELMSVHFRHRGWFLSFHSPVRSGRVSHFTVDHGGRKFVLTIYFYQKIFEFSTICGPI